MLLGPARTSLHAGCFSCLPRQHSVHATECRHQAAAGLWRSCGSQQDRSACVDDKHCLCASGAEVAEPAQRATDLARRRGLQGGRAIEADLAWGHQPEPTISLGRASAGGGHGGLAEGERAFCTFMYDIHYTHTTSPQFSPGCALRSFSAARSCCVSYTVHIEHTLEYAWWRRGSSGDGGQRTRMRHMWQDRRSRCIARRALSSLSLAEWLWGQSVTGQCQRRVMPLAMG